jgi:GTP-binding protein
MGTVVTEEDGTPFGELTAHGQRLLVAAGGAGGPGNQHYPTSTHQAPRKAKEGKPGEERALILELKLIADAGLIGLPNAGKSTLLRTLTHAKPRVAPYPFTTLHPNLGVMELAGYETVTLADIPGLVEGASRGVGLGDRFLRHIERTALLVHLIAPDPAHLGDPATRTLEEAEIGAHLALDAYHLVREELKAYAGEITRKPELVVLTKTDLLTPEETEEYLRVFRGEGIEAMPISANSGEGITDLKREIESRLRAMGRVGVQAKAAAAEPSVEAGA